MDDGCVTPVSRRAARAHSRRCVRRSVSARPTRRRPASWSRPARSTRCCERTSVTAPAVSTPGIKRRAWLTAAGVGVLLVVALLVNRATAKHATSSPVHASLVAAAGLADCPTTTGTSAVKNGLPSLTFPCLAQGPKVTLAKLRGPALLNIWAGPCEDCKIEAPLLRSFAVAARGRVAVLGVVDGAYNGSETWDDALDAAHGLTLGYPSVWAAKG